MGLKKKRAQMIGVVSTLAVASLVSVGFAAWTISNTQTKNTSSTIAVDAEVTNKSIGTLVLQDESNDKYDHNICFGAPASMNISGAWLTNDSAKPEDLYARFVYKFTVGAAAGTPTMTAPAWTATPDEVTTAITNKTIAALPTLTAGNGTDDNTYKLEADSAVTNGWIITITVKLSWGQDFGGENPYKHYNATIPPTDELIAEAKSNIEALAPLEGKTLKLSFTVSPAAPASNSD